MWGILELINASFIIQLDLGARALCVLGVIYVHPASSGPDMLLLLLKALIRSSAPFSPTRLTS